MINTMLYEIRDFIQQFIETIKVLIEFDLFVADENLLRVAGTGEYKKDIGLRLPIKCGTAYVLENGEPLNIYNPLDHYVCKDCSVRKDCYREAMMIYPIRDENRIIGAIALGSSSEEKINRQKRIEKELSLFLMNMSNYIVFRGKEKDIFGKSHMIINSIDEGLILTDCNGIVILSNEKMNKFLTVGEKIDTIFPNHDIPKILEDGKGYENRETQWETSFDDSRIFVSAKPIQHKSRETDILFTFKNYHSMENIVYKLMTDCSHLSSNLKHIIGNSMLLNQAKEIAIKASQSDSNVLIRGESGTGKELFAGAIHKMSKNRKGNYIAVNCAAIPENLLESELFGYEEGAFTGAKKGGKPGLFELADKGTIFLDEIGDLPLHLQPKLLRAIENRSIVRVGGITPIKINARIITATNRELEKDIEDEKFRKDLFYRLNVIPIVLPPLRKRQEDIMVLARFFLSKYTKKFSKKIKDFSEEVEKNLLLYDWPGNVRELENVIEYIVNLENTERVQTTSLPARLKNFMQISNHNHSNRNLKNIERQLIEELIKKHGSSVEGKEKIARELGISISTLYRKLRSFNM